MNYHIAIDHKYVESYIEDVIKADLKNNIFFIRNTLEESKHIKENDFIHFIGHHDQQIYELINSWINMGDRIFIHWLDKSMGDLILRINPAVEIFNVHWGGELLEDPYEYHSKWIYAPHTMAYLNKQKTQELKNRIFKKRLPIYPFLWYLKFQEQRSIKKAYKAKVKHVQRLKYNILHPANTADADLARKLYDHPTLIDIPGFYDLNFDLANSVPVTIKDKSDGRYRILINNAAFYSGNHLDAFYLLAKLKGDFIFYCPLAYLATEFRDMLVNKGKEILGDRFVPITEWMSKEKYLVFLSSIDIIFMYQNISQGFGNIVAALTMGKPILLRKQNSIKQLLKNIDIHTYDADQILSLDLSLICKQATEQAATNRLKLQDAFSEETRLNYLKEVLS